RRSIDPATKRRPPAAWQAAGAPARSRRRRVVAASAGAQLRASPLAGPFLALSLHQRAVIGGHDLMLVDEAEQAVVAAVVDHWQVRLAGLPEQAERHLEVIVGGQQRWSGAANLHRRHPLVRVA